MVLMKSKEPNIARAKECKCGAFVNPAWASCMACGAALKRETINEDKMEKKKWLACSSVGSATAFHPTKELLIKAICRSNEKAAKRALNELAKELGIILDWR